MTNQDKSTSTGFCPGCGMQLFSQWGFCPRCGRTLDDLHVSLWENSGGPLTPPPAVHSGEANDALELLRDGLVAEAEQKLRASMREAPADVELRIILAGVLFQRYDVQEAGALYDEALALAPDDFIVRLRRAEYLARLGRFTDALVDLDAARRLPAPDFPTLLYCQELQRWVVSKASGSFVRNTGPPKAVAWMKRLGARLRKAPTNTNGEERKTQQLLAPDAPCASAWSRWRSSPMLADPSEGSPDARSGRDWRSRLSTLGGGQQC